MSVYKRGKVYYMDFVIEGQRVFKSTKQKTKTLALKAERKEREKLEEQLLKRPLEDRMTLQEAVDGVWDEKWSKGRTGEQSYRNMEIIIEAMGNPHLDEINSQWVRKLKTWLGKQKLTVASQNRYLAHLKTVLRYARDEWEVINRIPKISLGRETAKRRRVVTDEELDTMISLLRNAPETHGKPAYFSLMADFIEVLVGTGMRLSEGLSLEPSNLATEGQIELFPEQTKSSMPRTIPMTQKVQATLAKLGKYPFHDLDMWKAQRCWKWIRKQMKIKDHDFCIHALRHTFASNLINNGVDFYTVQKLLGHSSASTTQRYAHMAVDTLAGAVDLLNRK
jgi:integrase